MTSALIEKVNIEIGGFNPIKNYNDWFKIYNIIEEQTKEDEDVIYVVDIGGWNCPFCPKKRRVVPKFIDRAFMVSPFVRDIFTYKVLPAILNYSRG